jgi:hypothetical protein
MSAIEVISLYIFLQFFSLYSWELLILISFAILISIIMLSFISSCSFDLQEEYSPFVPIFYLPSPASLSLFVFIYCLYSAPSSRNSPIIQG